MTITFKRVYIRNYASPCNATTNNACVRDANAWEQNQSKEKTLKTSPQNSLKLLPHWHRLPKWEKSLEGQYKLCSSIICVFLNKRVECNTHIQLPILGGRQTILRPKDCKRMICHKDITKRETNNQAIKRYQLKQDNKRYQLNQLDQ